MQTITSIKQQKGRKDRVSVFLDGSYGLGLSLSVVHENNLRVGLQLTDQEICILQNSELFHKAVNTAVRYLSYRPRSESETRTRLAKQKYDRDLIDNVIDKLKEQKLIDDDSFADFWTDNRQYFSPRSKRLIKLELRRKGVAEQIADKSTSDVDDQAGAHKVAQKKAVSLKNLDYDKFQKKLFGFLHNRGFSYQVISPAIETAWTQQGQEKAAE